MANKDSLLSPMVVEWQSKASTTRVAPIVSLLDFKTSLKVATLATEDILQNLIVTTVRQFSNNTKRICIYEQNNNDDEPNVQSIATTDVYLVSDEHPKEFILQNHG